MHRILLCFLSVFLTFSLLSCENSSQHDDSTADMAGADNMEEPDMTPRAGMAESSPKEKIRQWYAATEKARKDGLLQVDSVAYECAEESGKIYYYSDGKDLTLVRQSYSIASHYSATDSYYLRGGKPYFVFFDQLAWSFYGNAGPNSTRDNITEERYYIVNDTLIECLKKTYTIYSDKKGNPISEEVPNRKVECPSLGKVLEKFHAIMRHREEAGITEKIGCLEK